MVRKKQHKPRNPRPKIDYPPVETKKWIPPDERPKKKRKPPYKKPSKITVKLDRSSLKKVWHSFEIIENGRMLLVGHYSQFYKKYGFKSNGFQSPCNCVVACAFAQMFNITKWTSYTLDKILDVGDKLYQESSKLLPNKHRTYIKLDEVYHTYYIDNFRITMCLKGNQISGRMLPEIEEPNAHFAIMAKDFLKDNNFAIVAFQDNRFFAVWWIPNGYFIFDPCEYDEQGLISKAPVGRGFCILVRAKNLEIIRQIILDGLKLTDGVNPCFTMTPCVVARKFEINTVYPQCLEDANLELGALSDIDKQKIEELQIEKMKAKGALLLQPKPPDPNDRIIEVDEDYEEEKEQKEAEKKSQEETTEDKPPPTQSQPQPSKDSKESKESKEGEEPPQEEEDKEKEKLVLYHVKPPIEKVKAASLTYFRELIPDCAGILRGSMHQSDPKFMKCAGKQSLTMAISAVAMLRIFSSKYWTSTVLDEILRNGNQMYRESMKAFPGEPTLKITTLCETIKIEDREFAPKITPFKIVGKLGSNSEEILDLLRALKEFFLEEDACIVLGPNILAVWSDKGVYYMFDPNERDPKGLKIVRNIQIGSKIEILQVEAGTSCLTWFTNLKDLVEIYTKNVDQDRRREQFVLCKIQIEDYVKLPPNYYQYQAKSLTKWILKGTYSQNNKKFPDEIRNTQCTAIAVFAIGMNKLKHVKLWNSEDVDTVVEFGSKYYQECVDSLQAKNKFVSRLLMVDELNTSFLYDNKELKFDILSCLVNGSINNGDNDEILNLKMGLRKFFEECCCGILTCRGIAVAVFYLESYYYYFDSHTRNDEGLPSFYGTAISIRTTTIEELTNLILANLPPDTNDLYNLTKIDVAIYQGEGIPQPPLNHFIGLDKNRAILRSRFSENDERFGLNSGKQTIPMNLYALGMSKIIPTILWSVDIVNEILEMGNEHYIKCMEQIIQDEDKGKTVDVPQVVEVKIDEPKDDKNKDNKNKDNKDNKNNKNNDKDNDKDKDKDEKSTKGGKKRGGKKNKEEETPPPPPPPPEPVIIKPEVETKQEELTITSENVLKTFNIGINRFDVDFKETQEGTYEDLEETLKKIFIPEKDDSPQSILKSDSPISDDTNKKLYLIESKHMTCVMWCEDGVFFIFDSKPRDENGQIYGKEEWPKKKIRWNQKIIDEVDTGGAGDMTSDTGATISERKSDELNKLEEGHEYGVDFIFEDEIFEEEEEEYSEELERHSSHYWREKAKSGKAYVMRFIYPEDLIKHIIGNTPPLETELPYKLTTLNLTNTPMQKEIFESASGTKSNLKNVGQWNEFIEIDKGKWILRGTITETCEIFPEINRGRQTTAINILALSFQELYTLPVFKTQTVNDIAIYGDRLHTFSFNTILKIRREDGKLPEEELLEVVLKDMTNKENLAREFCIAGDMIQYSIEIGKIIGDIKAENQENLLDVKRGLETFFQDCKTGLLEAKGLLVAVWKKGTVYYMYDSHSRGPNGRKSINGVSCITRFLELEDLSNLFLSNLTPEGDNRFFIHPVRLQSMKCPREEVHKTPPKIQPPVIATPFQTVSPGKTVVRGSISQQDPVFRRQKDAQSVPVAFVALAMTLVHNPMFWTRPIIDEIVTIGDALYGQVLDNLGYNFNPWEQVLTVDLAPTDFKIGELKVSCEIRENEQTGIVDAKHSNVDNLRQGLEKFFLENTHGVISTEPLTVAIWEEQEPKKILYMFDPCPRGISGMPMNKENENTLCRGTACVITFDCYKAVADHFIALLSPETNVEFTITPVEVCVGKMKTKGKKKKKKEEIPLAIIGRGMGKEISKPCEKKKIRQLIKDMRKQEEERRTAKAGRKSFYMLPGNEMAILRGSRSQNSPFYCELSRGNQDIPNCLSAYVMERLLPFPHWTGDVINMVLDIGDQLYKDSYVVYHPTSKKLNLDGVIRDIVIKDVRVSIAIGKPVLFNQFTPICVEKALEMFFRQKMYCMMRMNCETVALFCKDDIYYMFDPHDLSLEGKKIDRGEAALMKFNGLKKMAQVIVDNYQLENGDETIFSLILVAIKAMQKMPKRLPKDLCD